METPSREGDWSKLCPDLLRMIFQLLNSIDSHRAKTVCSDWYSVWKTCLKKPPYPLQIIHQGNYFVSENQRILFRRSYCMSSYGNFLLMVDHHLLNFYILNLLTHKSIHLPSMRSPIRGKQVEFSASRFNLTDPYRMDYICRDTIEWKTSAVLWINETTGDYVVAWIFRQYYLFTHKKGDSSWWNLSPQGQDFGLLDVAYKNSKLYLFTTNHKIEIFDLSGETPKGVITGNPYKDHPFQFDEQPNEYIWKRKIAIQRSGEVLVILSLKETLDEKGLLFYIFKMNSESCKWERVDSIGDEMLIFGRGYTVSLALKDLGNGIKSDCIYFVKDDVWPDHEDTALDCGVFDIATSKIKWLKKQSNFSKGNQWFVRRVAY